MKKNYILSIGAGKNQILLIKKIKEMGFLCVSCDRDKNAPGRDISDIFFNISTYDYDEIIKKIVEENISLVDVLTRSSGQPVLTVAKISEAFGLTALDSKNAAVLTDKQEFISTLNSLKIPAPKLYLHQDIPKLSQKDFPLFVKPSKTNKSHAVMMTCHKKEEVKIAYENASKVSDNKQVNIEEYLIGKDMVSIDFVFHNEIFHICTMGEISSGPPNFHGIGWYSCDVNSKEDTIARKQFVQIKEKMGIKNGFFQSAMKLDLSKDSVKSYEIHAEIGGDFVSDVFIPATTKPEYDIFKNNISLAANIRPQSYDGKILPAVILFVEEIQQYDIQYATDMTDNILATEEYVMLFFKDYKTLTRYIKEKERYFSTNNHS